MNDTHPLAGVPRVTDVEVVLRRLVARAESPVDADSLADASQELLGVRATAAAQPALFRSGPQGGVAPAARLVPPSGDNDAAVVIDFDEPLARMVIDRTLGGDGASVPPGNAGRLSETECGVLAFALAHVLSETCDWRLAAVVGNKDAAAGILPDAAAVVLPVRIELGGDVGYARLWFGEAAARGLAQLAPDSNASDPMVEVVCDVGVATLSARDLASVVVGDAVTLDEFWAVDPAAPTRCRARLLTTGAIVVECAQTDAGLVVERTNENAVSSVERGARMTDDPTSKDQPAIDDVPIEIAVEVARTQLPLREFAALQNGEVLLTGQPLSGAVTLRSAGQAIATGELVQIDGEIAVRLTSVTSG